MLFFSKKLFGAMLLPIPIIFLLLLFSLLLLMFHYYKLGIMLASAAWIILFLFSTPWLPNYIIYSLENQYPPLMHAPPNISYIVVLGAGNKGKAIPYAANMVLNSSSLSRLVEGIRLTRQVQNSILVLSGGSGFNAQTDANLMYKVALALGLDKRKLKLESTSRDTYEEALKLKPILTTQPFVLVTSAYHMPRAMALFRKLGMQPIPAPTQFQFKSLQHSPKYYIPSTSNLNQADIALHEYIGLLWGRLRKQL